MPALLERPKMTRAMYEALKRHIMKEREKKKRAEQEQDEMMERLERERELRRKKEKEDSLTLEQTKEQILALEKKMEMLKIQKKELFTQLKKVLHLHQEVQTRRRKEQSEMTTLSQPAYQQQQQQQQQHPTLPPSQQPNMIMHGRPTLYKPVIPGFEKGIKRARSPTPPPSSSASNYQVYQSHNAVGPPQPPPGGEGGPKFSHAPPSDNKYGHSEAKYSNHGETKFVHTTEPKYHLPSGASFVAKAGAASGHLFPAQHSQASDYKSGSYPSPGPSHLYAAAAAANQSFQPQQQVVPPAPNTYGTSSQASSNPSKYAGLPSQSAFSSYPGHYSQSHPQKALAEPFPTPTYPPIQQHGYHAGLALQQSMEHAAAGQKQAGFEDKYKMGQNQIRVMVPTQQPPLISQALQLQQQQQQQQQQSKNAGSFVAGYPSRNKSGPPGANYPTSSAASSSSYSSQGGPQARTVYSSQSHGRYY